MYSGIYGTNNKECNNITEYLSQVFRVEPVRVNERFAAALAPCSITHLLQSSAFIISLITIDSILSYYIAINQLKLSLSI